MRSTISPSRWLNLSLVFSVLGLFGWTSASPGQSVFDPYQPYSTDYYSSSRPTLPNNLALPGQAREAGEYQSYNPVRGSAGTFDRFVNGDDSDFGSERRGGIGVPYYDVARQINPTTMRRNSSALTEADRAFFAFEAEKNRRYQNAIRERDPALRAKLLREVARMQPPQSTFSRGAETRKPTAKRTETSRNEALAKEALADDRPNSGSRGDADKASGVSNSQRRTNAGRTLDVRTVSPRRSRATTPPTSRPPLPPG